MAWIGTNLLLYTHNNFNIKNINLKSTVGSDLQFVKTKIDGIFFFFFNITAL